MSLMGYEEEDIMDMMFAIKAAKELGLTNQDGLQKTYDLLDGLLTEGRI